jgi:hypothetical protein
MTTPAPNPSTSAAALRTASTPAILNHLEAVRDVLGHTAPFAHEEAVLFSGLRARGGFYRQLTYNDLAMNRFISSRGEFHDGSPATRQQVELACQVANVQ